MAEQARLDASAELAPAEPADPQVLQRRRASVYGPLSTGCSSSSVGGGGGGRDGNSDGASGGGARR
jgi:hypothetical protein